VISVAQTVGGLAVLVGLVLVVRRALHPAPKRSDRGDNASGDASGTGHGFTGQDGVNCGAGDSADGGSCDGGGGDGGD
jgi:hypothetical protein